MNPTKEGQPVQVMLVGGAPLSGKTTVAQDLARLLGVPLIQTDIIGEAARAVTSPASHPDLHAYSFTDYEQYYVSHSPEVLLADAVRAHRALWPAIKAVIRCRLDLEGLAVTEGWTLLLERVAPMAEARTRNRLGLDWSL
ncbi:MAG: hypothetical protein GXX08_06175 [Firmicutes bacterium]|jgi:2-phosphoglycerate kinase|nr:hypothetical protein [Bacillota bacterium]